ncbi:MAG: Acetolactate synthase, mitochondrial [Chaenotheca gracillima]|nr:MAG: Acetolactate synthase, mitochondrial [Chaenotheca gracillima]
MSDTVPTSTSLKDIYPEDAIPIQQRRWEHLLASFEQEYEHKAEFVSRSPGRVNIIGEHIDYSLYEALPMAVTADLLLAISVDESSSKVSIANTHTSKFPTRTFDVPSTDDVEIDTSNHEWVNYFKSGLRGAIQLLRKKRQATDGFSPVGMKILVDGTVPSGGGLSSSAAFVCASALAVLRANGEEKIDKKELVELAIVSERAVGVHSGGLDQSASVLALRGSALYVSFKPKLHARAVEFPSTTPEMTFLIAQSFVAADKQATAPACYNLRVAECSLAAEVLAKKLGLTRALPKDAAPLEVSLRGLHDTYFEEIEGLANNDDTSASEFKKQLEKLVNLTKDALTQENGYTRQEMSSILGISEDQLTKRYLSKFPVRADRFLLRQRALHVYTEAIRVLDLMNLLTSPPSHDESLLQALGGILNETQNSCRDVYDCSCPELDELCLLARKAGAYGSRLTGAGWGGCSVHLVAQDKVDAVRQSWEKNYYRKRFPEITDEKLAEAVVISKPGSGSSIFKVTGINVV